LALKNEQVTFEKEKEDIFEYIIKIKLYIYE